MFVSNSSVTITIIYIYIYMLYYACYNLFNRLNICILDLLLHIYDITSHLYFLLNTSLNMAEYAEICSSCTCSYPFFLLALQPTVGMYFAALYWAIASSRARFLDHLQRRATVGRTPLDEWSVCRRDLWQHTTLTTDKHPCPQWDSNPRSQQASGRRPTP